MPIRMDHAAAPGPDRRALLREALRALGKRTLVLAIHDPSFPSLDHEDTGHGSPYGAGGRRFLHFARDLGFDGIQLGPQGQTSAYNPSPYDGTIFSRSTVSIALAPLVEDPAWDGLLSRDTLAALVAARPAPRGRAHHRHAHEAQRRALEEAWNTFRARGRADLAARRDTFAAEGAAWLERDARAHAEDLEFYTFCQFIAHEQHRALRALAADLGLKLYGDLQIGLSPRDASTWESVFLSTYRMGAPPSRTNPEGQPWNYPVLDPAQCHEGGAALAFLRARACKMFDAYDGVRIDHPHGLVCPWVYRAGTADPLRAVQQGARLFSSPDLPDHPELARYAIATPDQLRRSVPRYADDWVASLTPAQVDRYAVLFDAIVRCARENGRSTRDLVCEVLSTQPYPLQAVLARYGIGRFRVTQKADWKRPSDVYRSENAQPADWIMVGTHDTKPIWRLVREWQQDGTLADRAAYLAERLAPTAGERAPMARSLVEDPRLFVRAQFADLFASRAENVMIFFADLLGIEEVYNTPGTVSDDNWTLRVPADWDRDYAEKLARGAALDVPAALAMALRARGGDAALVERLEAGSASF